MRVLGIETSCDETAVAVVDDGRHVRASLVYSQVALHSPYGGVVPEIASRSHVQTLPGLLEQAVAESGEGWDRVDAVAVTVGPGLASSLLVGVGAARGLAWRLSGCITSRRTSIRCFSTTTPRVPRRCARSWRWWSPAGIRCW